MIQPVSNATQSQAVVQPKAAAPQSAPAASQPAQAKPQTPTDTVTISAAKQIAQESIETSSQTAREAAGGDSQARRLLAKEAADQATKQVSENQLTPNGTSGYGVPYSCLYTLALRKIAWTYSRVSVKGIDSTNSCGSRYFPWPSHSSTRSDPAL